MAIPDFRIIHTFIDSTSKESTTEHFFSGTFANAGLYAIELTADLDALSLSTLKGYTISQDVLISTTPPAGHVDNEVGGQFTFVNADGKARKVTVPGINEALVLPGTKMIDMSAATVEDYIVAVMDTAGAVDLNEIDITGSRQAYESFRGKVDQRNR